MLRRAVTPGRRRRLARQLQDSDKSGGRASAELRGVMRTLLARARARAPTSRSSRARLTMREPGCAVCAEAAVRAWRARRTNRRRRPAGEPCGARESARPALRCAHGPADRHASQARIASAQSARSTHARGAPHSGPTAPSLRLIAHTDRVGVPAPGPRRLRCAARALRPRYTRWAMGRGSWRFTERGVKPGSKCVKLEAAAWCEAKCGTWMGPGWDPWVPITSPGGGQGE